MMSTREEQLSADSVKLTNIGTAIISFEIFLSATKIVTILVSVINLNNGEKY